MMIKRFKRFFYRKYYEIRQAYVYALYRNKQDLFVLLNTLVDFFEKFFENRKKNK